MCVLYMGTFSKVLFPALRLSYLVVPTASRDLFAKGRHSGGRRRSWSRSCSPRFSPKAISRAIRAA